MGQVICNCNYIEKHEIIEFLQETPTANIEEVKRETGAGSSCGRCIGAIKQVMDEFKEKQ